MLKKRSLKKHKATPYNENNWEFFISQQKCIIENANAHINRFEIFKSVEMIAKMNNWQEFDVSEITEKTNDKMHCSFFGTETEYQNLLKTINK